MVKDFLVRFSERFNDSIFILGDVIHTGVMWFCLFSVFVVFGADRVIMFVPVYLFVLWAISCVLDFYFQLNYPQNWFVKRFLWYGKLVQDELVWNEGYEIIWYSKFRHKHLCLFDVDTMRCFVCGRYFADDIFPEKVENKELK